MRWARRPGFDAYWYFRDAFFESIVPPPGRLTLEIGCGEGRVARDLVERGHRVVALDSSRGLVGHATDRDASSQYLVAGGDRLPARDACVDLVVAYNVLQVVADMAATVRESARVLSAGGHLCVCVAHPVTDLGTWVGDDESTFAVRRRYFERARVHDTVERDGLRMTFRGWTYTLTDYALALESAGFCIETLREPRPASSNRYLKWNDLPQFMNIRASKR